MDFSVFLAMAPEVPRSGSFKKALLLCPFAENFHVPATISSNCLPVLTDSTAYAGQDAPQLSALLGNAVRDCPAVILDFQRKDQSGLRDFVQRLCDTLPCPVAAPPNYAPPSQPVFLPPVPPDTPIKDYLALWKGRDIWLDLAPSGQRLILTPSGCIRADAIGTNTEGFCDEALCCHYRIEKEDNNRVIFTLWRTKEDMLLLLEQLHEQGVTGCVGLYPEFKAAGLL